MSEYDDGDINTSENAQFVRLLKQAALPLEKGDAAVPIILYRLDLNLSPAHLCDRERSPTTARDVV